MKSLSCGVHSSTLTDLRACVWCFPSASHPSFGRQQLAILIDSYFAAHNRRKPCIQILVVARLLAVVELVTNVTRRELIPCSADLGTASGLLRCPGGLRSFCFAAARFRSGPRRHQRRRGSAPQARYLARLIPQPPAKTGRSRKCRFL